MRIFDNEYVINSSEPINCGERSFKISLEADVEPGDYRVQVSLIHPDTILPRILFNISCLQDEIELEIEFYWELCINYPLVIADLSF